MNNNIDIMMSNYITILSNPQMLAKFEPSVVNEMQKALHIYASTTATKYNYEFSKNYSVQNESEHINDNRPLENNFSK